ncbi:DUF202 domain-containing protein [Pedobacter sp. SYSU D00535]|uniref:DUF202 domain-containing protein n=1 Tax=Pedobacter sp. SYSU D00535 TaxID=2810308 RepID=UPI001A96D5F9
MNINPYTNQKILSITDELALGRNLLANERTLLSYVRTFLSFLVAGVSLIQFFDNRYIVVIGYTLIPLSFLFLIVGFIRYRKVKQALNRLQQNV